MRAHVVATAGLLLALHLAGPLVTPQTVPALELPSHLQETLRVEGRVVHVDPGSSVHRVSLQDATGRITLLVRGQPPPVGAVLEATGQAAGEDDGPVLWADATNVLASPDPAPRSLEEVLERAPELAGQPVAVVAAWDPAAHALTSPNGTLPVDAHVLPPPPGLVLAWGLLSYDPSRAGYRLEATGWTPWTPP